jgi:hypothetical protein
MSNKDNLPVKYEEAGKPKVKEQVTQWVEQDEVFDGFSTDFGLLGWVLLGGLAAIPILVAAELLFSDLSSIFWPAVTVLSNVWLLFGWYHWDERLDKCRVEYIFRVIATISAVSSVAVISGSLIISEITAWTAPVSIIWVMLTPIAVALAADYVAENVETRTEERVVSSNGGEQL